MAGLIGALRHAGHRVTVLDAEEIGLHPKPFSIGHFARLGPRQGSIRMRGGLSDAIVATRADVVIYSLSYMAAYHPEIGIPVVVDFQNIERDRYRSLARGASGYHRLTSLVESGKAALWEPPVARKAQLNVACTEEDAEIIRSWGGRVIVCPHGSDTEALSASPADGYVLMLGSAGYLPNDQAIEWLIKRVWPRVLNRLPGAQLRIAGRGTADAYGWAASENITVAGDVESIVPELAGAAVVAAPVVLGAGAQLKVAEALAHARSLVATSYSLRSCPSSTRGSVLRADDIEEFADGIVRRLTNVEERHRAEEALRARPISWNVATQPLIDWLRTGM
jgi:hypothetical protein